MECCLSNRLTSKHHASSEGKTPSMDEHENCQLFRSESLFHPQIVPLKKMKSDEICDLLDSLGFYKRSQKGEDVPEEFMNFPLKAPRDEL